MTVSPGQSKSTRLLGPPDSKWLVYTQQESQPHALDLSLFLGDGSEPARLRRHERIPLRRSFDRSGKYLYFLASTDAGPTKDTSMLSYGRPVTTSVYIVVLRRDLPSPLAPESDEEGQPSPTPKSESPKPDETKPESSKSPGQG